jgi:hypothetical protein
VDVFGCYSGHDLKIMNLTTKHTNQLHIQRDLFFKSSVIRSSGVVVIHGLFYVLIFCSGKLKLVEKY